MIRTQTALALLSSERFLYPTARNSKWANAYPILELCPLGRSLALDSGWSDRSHYLLAKGAAPNAPAGAARWPTSWIPLFSELRIGAMMVLAPGELKEVRGHRFSIADFRSALVIHWLFSRKKLKR
jgi:hypothetical protein